MILGPHFVRILEPVAASALVQVALEGLATRCRALEDIKHSDHHAYFHAHGGTNNTMRFVLGKKPQPPFSTILSHENRWKEWEQAAPFASLIPFGGGGHPAKGYAA